MGRGRSPLKYRTVRRRGAEYPRLLEEISSAPARLYATGKALEPAPYVAVVGSRKPSRYGIEVATWIAAELAEAGVVVVSGMAKGIDAAAHRGALKAGAPTVAVLGSGLDICYPWQNQDLYLQIATRGTLVSEYEAGMRAFAYNFPARNRIIAGMSLGVVIVEGRVGGGAMITARLAAEFGREVFAVAGPVHSAQSEGPHALIRDGARLVTSAGDILEDLGMSAPEQQALQLEAEALTLTLTPDERMVLGRLEADPVVLDLVAAQAKLPASATAATLSLLELKGLAIRHPGGLFSRAPAGRARR